MSTLVDQARKVIAALDFVFRNGDIEAVQHAQKLIRQLADRVQELDRDREDAERWDIKPQLADPKAGPEPSLREILFYFYTSHDIKAKQAQKFTDAYIDAIRAARSSDAAKKV